MKNKEVLQLYDGLGMILSKQELRFPAKVSFSIMRNFKILDPIAQDILIAREGVLQTYGTPSEDKPGYYVIPPENRETAQQELDALESVDQDIKLLKIKLADLEGMEFSLEEMDSLYNMLEEE